MKEASMKKLFFMTTILMLSFGIQAKEYATEAEAKSDCGDRAQKLPSGKFLCAEQVARVGEQSTSDCKTIVSSNVPAQATISEDGKTPSGGGNATVR